MHAAARRVPAIGLPVAAALLIGLWSPGSADAGQVAQGSAGPGPATPHSAGPGPATPPIQVSVTGPVRTVTPWLLGLNGDNLTGPPWNNSKLDAVLRKFGPGTIRYPGGTDANYWDWPKGWFQPGQWPSETPTPIDDKIPVFHVALQAAGATPIYDLNVLTYSGAIGTNALNATMLAGQLQFLHAAAAAGLPVKMVELGNELYLTGAVNHGTHGQDYATRFPTAADYASQMNTWIAAIHKAFPGAQVAAVGADPNYIPGVSQRRQTWDTAVLPALQGEDVMTVHEIQRVYQSGPASTVLAQPYIRYQTFKANQLPLFTSRSLPIWISAFNMEDQTSGQVIQGTWLHGLYVAEQALIYLANPEFQYIGLSGGVGTAHGGAIFDGPQGLGIGKPATVPLALTAAGTTMSAIQAAFHGATTSQPLAFTPTPTLGTTGAPALLGEEVITPGGQKLVVVNTSSQSVTLSLGTLFPSGFKATEITAPSVTTLVTGPTSTTATTTTGTGRLQVGPYTLATVAP
jgi:hypothetical protein